MLIFHIFKIDVGIIFAFGKHLNDPHLHLLF